MEQSIEFNGVKEELVSIWDRIKVIFRNAIMKACAFFDSNFDIDAARERQMQKLIYNLGLQIEAPWLRRDRKWNCSLYDDLLFCLMDTSGKLLVHPADRLAQCGFTIDYTITPDGTLRFLIVSDREGDILIRRDMC